MGKSPDGGEVEEGVDGDGGPEVARAFVDVAEAEAQEKDLRPGPPWVQKGKGDGGEDDREPGEFEGVAEEGLQQPAEEELFGQRGEESGGEDVSEAQPGRGIGGEDFQKLVGRRGFAEAVEGPFGQLVEPEHEGENEQEEEGAGEDAEGESTGRKAEAAERVAAGGAGGKETGAEDGDVHPGAIDDGFGVGKIVRWWELLMFEDQLMGLAEEQDGQGPGGEGEADGDEKDLRRFIGVEATGAKDGGAFEDAEGGGNED